MPFSAFATSRWETGSPRLERYNGYSAVEIVGESAAGVSNGTALDIMENLVSQLPTGIGLQWTGASPQERMTGAQAPCLYASPPLGGYLCLAAVSGHRFPSFSSPFPLPHLVG